MPGKIETYSNVEMARKLKKINCYFEITDRQIEFLKYCASEFTYKEIGEKMNISHKTVEKHRDLLFSKLNVNTRIELAIFSIQSGITDNFR
jgi:DNA-binding NarL/FixJ family response regulator